MGHTEYMRGWRRRKLEGMTPEEREDQRQAQRAYMRAWKKKNTDKVCADARKQAQKPHVKAYRNAWKRAQRIANPEKQRAYRQVTRARHGARYNIARRGGRAGLTISEFRALEARANGACEICRKPCERMHIDHDHSTGRVRGLLCSGCNTFLGYLEKRASILGTALEYIERHRK